MEEQRRKHGSADYRDAEGVMRDTLVRLVNEDYRDLLPGISAPVELVWGAHGHGRAAGDGAGGAGAASRRPTWSSRRPAGTCWTTPLYALLRERL